MCTARHREHPRENTVHFCHFHLHSEELISPGWQSPWYHQHYWTFLSARGSLSWDSRAFESCLWHRAPLSLTLPVLSKAKIKLHNPCIWKHWTLSSLNSHTIRDMNGVHVQAHILGFIFLHIWNHNNSLHIVDFSSKPGSLNDSFLFSLSLSQLPSAIDAHLPTWVREKLAVQC